MTDIKKEENRPIKQLQKDSRDHFIYKGMAFIPGIVRLRDAPYYLGMNKTFFRDSVQPYLTRIPIDKKGIGFSRLELDCWIAYARPLSVNPLKSHHRGKNFTIYLPQQKK